MRCYIKEIAIFGKDGSKRSVVLEEGLNIINGNSQSGKSALLEITDYCLLSPRSTIPHGKIIDYADLFVLILNVENEFIVIGRPSPNTANSSKVYFNIESSESAIGDLQKSYFDGMTLVSKDTIKKGLGRYFNFDVKDTTLNTESALVKKGNASFRNMVPFLFQHQSLVANKYALFYKFDDRSKRERIVDEFPIFMGWVGGEYYRLNRELNENKSKLRRLLHLEKTVTKNKAKLTQKVKSYIEDYYEIIGVKCPNINLHIDILNLARNLPDFTDKSYILADYEEKRDFLVKQRMNLYDQKTKIKREIFFLDNASNDVTAYKSDIFKLTTRSSDVALNGDYSCPLCNQGIAILSEKISVVCESRQNLFNDVRKLNNYYVDNSATIEKLKIERDVVSQKLIDINAEIQLVNKVFKNKDQRDLKQQATEIKNLIEISVDLMFGDTNLLFSNDEIKTLKVRIEFIEQKLKGYNLDLHQNIFDNKVKKDMNVICSKLDFEEELSPPNLCFISKNFDFYHDIGNSKVLLSEMGSGANWLACHISLLLALHKQFASTKGCSVPSFVFFDQPSQVYFPTEFDPVKDKDLRNVANIFDVIIETLDEICVESGFKPQVIVTDHANNLSLKNNVFNEYVRYSWFGDDKLI